MSTRPVPTMLDSWPGVTDLVGSYKHILHVLWSSPAPLVSVLGVGGPGIIERLTGATRLDEPVVLEALRELDRRRLVVFDEETREVAIRRWCQFHQFKGRWASAAAQAFTLVASAKIKGVLVKEEGVKSIFPEKSIKSSPNSNCNNNSMYLYKQKQDGSPPSCAAAPGKKFSKSRAGVICWNDEDRQTALGLERKHGLDQVKEVVAELEQEGVEPFPSRVTKAILNLNSTAGGIALPSVWWQSEEATLAAGDILGILPRPGESMEQYRSRIRQEQERVKKMDMEPA